jgi:outer membrane protein assembly factor BamD
LLLAGLGSGLGLGCGSSRPALNPLEYSENAKYEYDQAIKAYFDQDWEEAELLFKEVKRKYGYSRYARLADLRLADIQFRQEKYAEAISAYKGFVHDYPNDPEVPYARYRVAKSLFEQSSMSFLLPPLEERDLANVNEAYDVIRAFLQDFPNYKRTRELEYMLEVTSGVLARHELYVARFYLNKGNFPAAVSRCQYALRHLEGSGLEAEAMVLLGETYMKMKKRKKARAVLRQMLAMYPASPFGLPARGLLRLMGDDTPVPQKPVD